VHERERHDLLLDPVLEDLEVFLLQIGDELPGVVAAPMASATTESPRGVFN
jgi:hypothetical protein